MQRCTPLARRAMAAATATATAAPQHSCLAMAMPALTHSMQACGLHTRAALAAPTPSRPLQAPAAAAAPAPAPAAAATEAAFPAVGGDAAAAAADDSAPGFTKSTTRAWHLFDARDQVVGRMAGRIAALLSGKHKPTVTPWLDDGDAVVVLNAKYLKFTGNKWTQKLYRYHTGYPGGLKEIPAERWRHTHPERILRHAVAGMIRKNKLKLPRLARLKIYPGVLHPHAGQFPFDVVDKVPHLRKQRDEELAAEAAAKQAETDAVNLAPSGGKNVAPAAAAAEAAKAKKDGPLLATFDDKTLPENADIRAAVLKDREQRKGKPYAHTRTHTHIATGSRCADGRLPDRVFVTLIFVLFSLLCVLLCSSSCSIVML